MRILLTVFLAGTLAPFAAAQTFTDQAPTLLNSANFESRSVSFGDIDNDGDPDILFQGAVGALKLFRNNVESGTLSFTDITSAFVPSVPNGWSAAWADYDGDGDVDVFLGQTNSGSARGVLFRNDGTAFTNVSSTTINDPGFHQNVAWCDIDNDLDLDLIIAMEGPEKHEIYLQQANGSFIAVGAAADFQQPYGTKAYGMAIGDYDGDGDKDIYLSTCIVGGNIRNNFYKNQLTETSLLTFLDIADTNGTQYTANSYGTEFHDFDDDGDLDLFMTGADGNDSKIWRNDGAGVWTDVDELTMHSLLSDNGGDLNGGHPIDYDNDGDLDIFLHDQKPQSGKNSARKLYRNDGNWEFTDVTVESGLSATNEGAYDSSIGDIDLDGDLDIVCATESHFPERVFISNASTNGNHWLYIRPRANAPNTRAIGAQLYATINIGTPQERTLRRDANANAGTFAQNDLPVHFGLGAAEKVDVLRIVWPDNTETIHEDIAGDQYITLTQPELIIPPMGWVIQ